MDKQAPPGVFRPAVNTSLPDLQTQFGPPSGFMNPSQPKRAWVRHVTNKKQPGGSPQHQDLVTLDALPAQPQPQPFNLVAGKLRKNPLALPKQRVLAPPRAKDESGVEFVTSRDNKQWEFRMPGVAGAGQQAPGAEAPPHSDADTSKVSIQPERPFKAASLLLPTNRLQKQPLPPGRFRASLEPTTVLLERKQSYGSVTNIVAAAKINQANKISPTFPLRGLFPLSTTSRGGVDGGQLQVEGSAMSGSSIGGIDDETVLAVQALGALEVSVGKERRLKEEMARNHKVVLKSFRGVVAAFFAGVNSAAVPRKSLALAKCSVVVHTLASTIQTYLRWRQSHQYLALLQQGLSVFASRIALSAQLPTALDPSMLDAPYSPSPHPPSITETDMASTPFSTDSGSTMHDNVLDSTAIAHLKQLYFDYYDCECFILPGMRGTDDDDDVGSDVQMLDMECRSVHSVIEERNVLLPPSAGGDTLPEEEAGCHRPSSASPTSSVMESLPNGSMVFDETVERERIFGADTSSEESEDDDSVSEDTSR